jgi:hypothetical protein
VVALVDDDEPVAVQQLARLFTARDDLDHRDVHRLGGALLARTYLTSLDVEVGPEAISPLFQQRLPIDQHQRRGPMMSDQSARHHGLSRSRRRLEDPEVVPSHRVDGRLLCGSQRAFEGHLHVGRLGSFVDDDKTTPCVLDHAHRSLGQSAGQVQMLEIFDEAPDEAWCGVVGQPQVLVLVELGVVQRREVLQGRVEPGRDPGTADGEHGA